MNGWVSRLGQQSLSHMTSLNPGSSTQSYQAHNAAGFPVLPVKDECFYQGKSPRWKYSSPWEDRKSCWTVGLVWLAWWPSAIKGHKSFSQIYWHSLRQLLSVFGLGLILGQTCEIETGWPLFSELRSSRDIKNIPRYSSESHCRCYRYQWVSCHI